MKQAIVTVVLVCSTLIGFSQKVVNDPNAEQRTVGSFSEIRVSHAIDLYLSEAATEAVAVSASAVEYRDRIKTEVSDGVLKIWYDEKKWGRSGNRKLKAYVGFRELRKLTASGASDVFVTGTIKSDKLELNMSGASDFKGAVDAGSLHTELSGASDVVVSGKVSDLMVDASGASDFKGFDLTAQNCTVEASGASHIDITFNGEMKARASGASGVSYKGSGVIRDLKTSGASSVSRR
jgi:hypothetical protein